MSSNATPLIRDIVASCEHFLPCPDSDGPSSSSPLKSFPATSTAMAAARRSNMRRGAERAERAEGLKERIKAFHAFAQKASVSDARFAREWKAMQASGLHVCAHAAFVSLYEPSHHPEAVAAFEKTLKLSSLPQGQLSKCSAQVLALIRAEGLKLPAARIKMDIAGQHFGGIAAPAAVNATAAAPDDGDAAAPVSLAPKTWVAPAGKTPAQMGSFTSAMKVLGRNFLQEFRSGNHSFPSNGTGTNSMTSGSSNASSQAKNGAIMPEKRRATALEEQREGHAEEGNKRTRYANTASPALSAADLPADSNIHNALNGANGNGVSGPAASMSKPDAQSAASTSRDPSPYAQNAPLKAPSVACQASNSPRIPHTTGRLERVAVVPSSDTEEEDDSEIQEIEKVAKLRQDATAIAQELALNRVNETSSHAERRDDFEQQEGDETARSARAFSDHNSHQHLSAAPTVSRQDFRKTIYHIQFFQPVPTNPSHSMGYAAQHHYLPHKGNYLPCTTPQSSALLCSSQALRPFKARLAHRREHKLERNKDEYIDFGLWTSRELASEAKNVAQEAAARLAQGSRT